MYLTLFLARMLLQSPLHPRPPAGGFGQGWGGMWGSQLSTRTFYSDPHFPMLTLGLHFLTFALEALVIPGGEVVPLERG